MNRLRAGKEAASSSGVRCRLEAILTRYSEIFKNELGTIRGEEAHLYLKEERRPKFLKARSVPYALRPAVEKEIIELQEIGILRTVCSSEFATPVVPAIKRDGSIRLCGDYKTTINPMLDVDQYPIPRVDELFSTLAGGTRFSKIDLNRAYQQVLMNEDSSKLLTLNTHMGLYAVNRLLLGVASAPAIFQKIMDGILKGLPGVICYLDDILITERTEEEHLQNLEKVLKRL
ncbi:uncharacterized protein K02A2.6-like [Ornithodoros turicata]|uniref:uncharacterized protein K02A2.6-like n=1 Tax=Ornithodoros turicata TaxID=34597 RepID=UPI00313A0C9F